MLAFKYEHQKDRHAEHRDPTSACAQPSDLYAANPWLCSNLKPQTHFVCRRHDCAGHHYQWCWGQLLKEVNQVVQWCKKNKNTCFPQCQLNLSNGCRLQEKSFTETTPQTIDGTAIGTVSSRKSTLILHSQRFSRRMITSLAIRTPPSLLLTTT